MCTLHWIPQTLHAIQSAIFLVSFSRNAAPSSRLGSAHPCDFFTACHFSLLVAITFRVDAQCSDLYHLSPPFLAFFFISSFIPVSFVAVFLSYSKLDHALAACKELISDALLPYIYPSIHVPCHFFSSCVSENTSQSDHLRSV